MFPDDFNKRGLELIQEKKYNEAEVMLRQAVESMPDGWKPIEATATGTLVHAWSDDEFAAYREWCVWQVHLAHFGCLFWPTLSH